MKKILLLICLLAPSLLLAKPAYVSDELEIMVRSGKSGSHRIIATLRSGARVDILQYDEASRYSNVSFGDGRKGWVLGRLLQKAPASKARLASAKVMFEKQTTELKELKAKLNLLGNAQGDLDTQAAVLQTNNTALTKELEEVKEASADAIQILEERNQLQQRVVSVERELENVKRKNNVLSNNDSQSWFLIGGSVMLLGLVFGFFLPKLSWRKKSSWNSSF